MRWSLIVATMGRTQAVGDLLASLARQTVTSFQVILVDQNPDERLVPVAAAWADRLDVVHVRIPPRGVSQARNVGLSRMGEADFVAFPDDDCVYEPETLARAEAVFAYHPTIEALLGDWLILGAPKQPYAGSIEAIRPVGRIGCLSRSPTFVLFFRREVAIQAGGFDETLGPGGGTPWLCGEDTDFLLRAGGQRGRVARAPSVRVSHPSVDASIRGYEGKAYGYGRGRIRLLRKHGYPMWLFLVHLLHPILTSLISTPRRRLFRWHLFKGRLREVVTPWPGPGP